MTNLKVIPTRIITAVDSLPSPASSGSHEAEELEQTNGSTRAPVRRCNYCSATSTPMWRHGPGNYTNLCNSCGVKWRRGKILSNGEHRHHLCKPTTPKKRKDKVGSPIVAKRQKDLYWQRPAVRNSQRPSWTPEASQEPEEVPVEPVTPSTPEAMDVCEVLNSPPVSPKLPPFEEIPVDKSEVAPDILAISADILEPPVLPTELSLEISMEPVEPLVFHEVGVAPVSVEGPNLVVPPTVEPPMNQVEAIPFLPAIPLPCPEIEPSEEPEVLTSSQVHLLVEVLSSEFADLLEKLPYYKTATFTSILANCFRPKVAEAYRKGQQVEMSVLDITQDTWDALRRVVC